MARADKKALIVISIIIFWVLVIAASTVIYSQIRKQDGAKSSPVIMENEADSRAEDNFDSGSAADNAEQSSADGTESPAVVQKKPDSNAAEDQDALTPGQVVQKTLAYINGNLLSDGVAATSDYKVSEVSGIYKFKITVDGNSYDVYVTKDGELMFPQTISMSEGQKTTDAGENDQAGKTDKPDVKVFVMSYCPYGLQAQKIYLPVYNLLKDKATMGIYFVNYAMHGKKEIDENLRQYCIQKEQPSKYAAYLGCFTTGTVGSDGTADFAGCLDQALVDKTKLNACVAATDTEFNVTADYNDSSTWLSGRYPKFTVNDPENNKYGVQGSPAIIINGKEVSLNSRSPQSFLKAVCDTFTSPPAECDTALSDEQSATGFGKGTATGSSGGCGG